jgi:hypothetical protein
MNSLSLHRSMLGPSHLTERSLLQTWLLPDEPCTIRLSLDRQRQSDCSKR